MKKIFALYAVLMSSFLFAQSEIKITSKKCNPKAGYGFQLTKVFDDSRCPEGVTCIWAGEVSVVIKVYKNKKFFEQKAFTFNAKNKEENFNWFAKYYSKKIKSIAVVPYPKEGQIIKVKNQYISIVFEN
jgi:hypothetical protein